MSVRDVFTAVRINIIDAYASRTYLPLKMNRNDYG
jgi:hypothetical protein